MSCYGFERFWCFLFAYNFPKICFSSIFLIWGVIPIFLLRRCYYIVYYSNSEILIYILLRLCLSWNVGIYSKTEKSSFVEPIRETDGETSVYNYCNYRLNSKLGALSKHSEKLAESKLSSSSKLIFNYYYHAGSQKCMSVKCRSKQKYFIFPFYRCAVGVITIEYNY